MTPAGVDPDKSPGPLGGIGSRFAGGFRRCRSRPHHSRIDILNASADLIRTNPQLSDPMSLLLSFILLAESIWEKKHPVFGVSFGTLLLIWYVMNELKKNQK